VRDFGPNGTLREVESGLDRIRKLGIDAIWLMPIHPTGVKKRKGPLGSPYAVRDFRAIDPALGTDADLRSLVWAAHRRGMKIMLDLVPNHCARIPLPATASEWNSTRSAGPPSTRSEWKVSMLGIMTAGLRRRWSPHPLLDRRSH
jgi:maltooligosyltrehalose synthase